MDKIRQYTEEEVLYDFWNKHLSEYMAAKINVELAKEKTADDPEQVLGYKQSPSMGNGLPPSMVDLRAKDYLKMFEKKAKEQKELLDIINKLIKSKKYYA